MHRLEGVDHLITSTPRPSKSLTLRATTMRPVHQPFSGDGRRRSLPLFLHYAIARSHGKRHLCHFFAKIGRLHHFRLGAEPQQLGGRVP